MDFFDHQLDNLKKRDIQGIENEIKESYTLSTYSDPAIYSKFPADRIMGDDEFLDCPKWFYDALVEKLKPFQKKPNLWQYLRRKYTSVYNPRV